MQHFVTINFIARLVVGGVLVWAGAGHFLNALQLIITIGNYQLLPAALLPAAAIVLPAYELSVGAALLANLQARIALFQALVLFSIFLLAVGSAMVRELPISCGCFYGSESRVSILTVFRIIGFMGIVVVALVECSYSKDDEENLKAL